VPGRKQGSTSTSNANATTNTTAIKSTGPSDCGFQQNLIDGGIYPDEYEYPDGRVSPQPLSTCIRQAVQVAPFLKQQLNLWLHIYGEAGFPTIAQWYKSAN